MAFEPSLNWIICFWFFVKCVVSFLTWKKQTVFLSVAHVTVVSSETQRKVWDTKKLPIFFYLVAPLLVLELHPRLMSQVLGVFCFLKLEHGICGKIKPLPAWEPAKLLTHMVTFRLRSLTWSHPASNFWCLHVSKKAKEQKNKFSIRKVIFLLAEGFCYVKKPSFPSFPSKGHASQEPNVNKEKPIQKPSAHPDISWHNLCLIIWLVSCDIQLQECVYSVWLVTRKGICEYRTKNKLECSVFLFILSLTDLIMATFERPVWRTQFGSVVCIQRWALFHGSHKLARMGREGGRNPSC